MSRKRRCQHEQRFEKLSTTVKRKLSQGGNFRVHSVSPRALEKGNPAWPCPRETSHKEAEAFLKIAYRKVDGKIVSYGRRDHRDSSTCPRVKYRSTCSSCHCALPLQNVKSLTGLQAPCTVMVPGNKSTLEKSSEAEDMAAPQRLSFQPSPWFSAAAFEVSLLRVTPS